MSRRDERRAEERALHIERRWPAVLAILFMELLWVGLPNRFRLGTGQLPNFFMLLAVIPMIGVALTAGSRRWLRAERAILWIFVVASGSLILVNLTTLIRVMLIGTTELTGLQLLASGIAIWVANVVIFSLAYWHVDRGGPEARLNRLGRRPDWLFPQEGVPDLVFPDWRPTFIDYLFLGFCTATAFSPTGAVPLTARAMLLMMLEGAISLVTIAVVASRAINILGS